MGWTALMGFAAGCGGKIDSASPVTSISKICSDGLALPCWPDRGQAECEARWQKARADVASDGCGGAFDTLLSCVSNHPMTCSDDGTPQFMPECKRAL